MAVREPNLAPRRSILRHRQTVVAVDVERAGCRSSANRQGLTEGGRGGVDSSTPTPPTTATRDAACFGGAHWHQVGRGRLGVVVTLEQPRERSTPLLSAACSPRQRRVLGARRRDDLTSGITAELPELRRRQNSRIMRLSASPPFDLAAARSLPGTRSLSRHPEHERGTSRNAGRSGRTRTRPWSRPPIGPATEPRPRDDAAIKLLEVARAEHRLLFVGDRHRLVAQEQRGLGLDRYFGRAKPRLRHRRRYKEACSGGCRTASSRGSAKLIVLIRTNKIIRNANDDIAEGNRAISPSSEAAPQPRWCCSVSSRAVPRGQPFRASSRPSNAKLATMADDKQDYIWTSARTSWRLTGHVARD